MTGTVSYELLFESLDKQWNKNISSYELKAGVLIVKIKCCCDFSVFLFSQPGYKGTTCTCKPIVRVTLTGWQVGNPTLLCSWVLFTSRWDNLIWILWVMRVDGLYGIWSQDILGILSALLTVLILNNSNPYNGYMDQSGELHQHYLGMLCIWYRAISPVVSV